MRAVDEALIMAVLTIAIVVGVLTAGPIRGASSLPDNGRMSAGGQIK